MKHRNCGGEIINHIKDTNYLGYYIDNNGEQTELKYDEPGGEIEFSYFECNTCGKKWETREELLKANVRTDSC